MAVSIVGIGVAFSIYHVEDAKASVGTSQSLTITLCKSTIKKFWLEIVLKNMIVKSAVSFIFVGLYLLAARRTELVSKKRPPTLPLHGACFIIIRITALL
jgi:hypothetical protein